MSDIGGPMLTTIHTTHTPLLGTDKSQDMHETYAVYYKTFDLLDNYFTMKFNEHFFFLKLHFFFIS